MTEETNENLKKHVLGKEGLNEYYDIEVENGFVKIPTWEFVLLVRDYRIYKYSTYVYVVIIFALILLYLTSMIWS